MEQLAEVENVESTEDEVLNSGEEAQAPAAEDEDSDEVVVTIGDESPTPTEEEAQPAPEWVKELRRKNREDQKRIRELETKLREVTEPKPKAVELGPKPTLESLDYDAERYEQELAAWFERKREADEKRAAAEKAERDQTEAWNAKLRSYEEAKGKLKVPDFEDAEHVAQEVLSATQQGIILQGADNPATLIYAIGKNPQKAKELAAITDPVKYAIAIGKLEVQLKVTPKKAPPPERTITAASVPGGAIDSTLERLRAEAEKTGDYSKVVAYKRQKRAA